MTPKQFVEKYAGCKALWKSVTGEVYECVVLGCFNEHPGAIIVDMKESFGVAWGSNIVAFSAANASLNLGAPIFLRKPVHTIHTVLMEAVTVISGSPEYIDIKRVNAPWSL